MCDFDDFYLRVGTLNREVIRVVGRNIPDNRKVLLSSFHLNGHTLGFHPQTQFKCLYHEYGSLLSTCMGVGTSPSFEPR